MEASGERELAREASEKIIEALKKGFSITASWRVLYRKTALARLKATSKAR